MGAAPSTPGLARTALERHFRSLTACRLCPLMLKPVVVGRPVLSKVILVGQAPGDKEPIMGRPFAWTAGRTLFRWFETTLGLSEEQFRSSIYMAAVCRCFPGKRPEGGDRVPNRSEIVNCSRWLEQEMAILQPELVIPVGKLAIVQFLALDRLDSMVGRSFSASAGSGKFDVIPLPHPSGASPWHRMEPGITHLTKALKLIQIHPAMRQILASSNKPA